ncbi:hypothetical protein I4U23_015109 [Adineta vaga]|nr:hypothetical protein I4U23_015109 [Adineta vaga]
MNGLIIASNYYRTNQTCQLMTSNLNLIMIQVDFDSSLQFLNRTAMIITDIGTSPAACNMSQTSSVAQSGSSILYTFDNTTNDYYGNYNAIPYNNPVYISPGYNGRGSTIQILSNASQYLTVANYMNFYNKSLTVEAWIYPLAVFSSSTYIDMIIYAQTNTTQQPQLMWLMLRNGKGYGAFYANDVIGPTAFLPNRWQHIAFTYDRRTATQVIYYNGVADSIHTEAPPCVITAGIQTIGTYQDHNGGFFHGYIDQLQIFFNRAKTATEILNDATLVGYYPMDCLTNPGLDNGPNSINGTAVELRSSDGGRVGQSYLFNTNASYFQVTGLVLLGQSCSPYSFSLWLRPKQSVMNGGTILHVSQNMFGSDWCIPFLGLSSSGQIVANGYHIGGIIEIIGPILTIDYWVHIILTYSEANGMRLYINGILFGQSVPFVYAAAGVPMTVTLGQSLNGNECYHSSLQTGVYRGQMDEFYIYSRELSQADATRLANP